MVIFFLFCDLSYQKANVKNCDFTIFYCLICLSFVFFSKTNGHIIKQKLAQIKKIVMALASDIIFLSENSSEHSAQVGLNNQQRQQLINHHYRLQK